MDKRSDSHAGINAASELKKIRAERSIRRRQGCNYRSKLEPHRRDLVNLYHGKANFEDLAFWLRHEKKLKVHPTTIMRYLYKLPELVRRNG